MLHKPKLLLVIALASPAALAQTGTLDQVSPIPGNANFAGYNFDLPGQFWQQEVVVGMTGQLEGFELARTGPAGSTFEVRLRLGNGWAISPVVWSGTSPPGSGVPIQQHFFDVTSAGIALQAGDAFVIEVEGNDSGATGLGSYVEPPGAPLYGPNLYRNGPGCHANCGWRIAFRTWMLDDVGLPFCSGSAAVLCPCGNQGSGGEGCANSSGSGAVLTANGAATVAPDVLGFDATHLKPNQPALLFVGNNAVNGGLGTLFGDGLRCAGGSIRRLGVRVPNVAGDATWGPGLQPAGMWAPGDTRRFQAWYRDPAGPCGTGFNLSNGLEITFF